MQHDLEDPDRGMMFVSFAAHKTKNLFFFLLQTEQGDVFKVTLTTEDNDMVGHQFFKYFPCLCMFMTGRDVIFFTGNGNQN